MEWLKILPPVVAIIVVLWKKEVILALVLAIFTSEFLLGGSLFNHTTGIFNQIFVGSTDTLERVVSVFGDAGNTRILIFSVMVGSLLAYMRHSGGVSALVNNLISKGFYRT